LSSLKTGTPPLRGGVDGPPSGGEYSPPTGWLDKPLAAYGEHYEETVVNPLNEQNTEGRFAVVFA